MKVCFAVKNNAGLDSKMDARFGRANYFLIYDIEKEKIVSIEANMLKNEKRDVGIKTVTFIVGTGCKVAVGAQPGSKAAEILEKTHVKIIVNDKDTVRDVLEKYKEELTV